VCFEAARLHHSREPRTAVGRTAYPVSLPRAKRRLAASPTARVPP
jgi:hypothetical protein